MERGGEGRAVRHRGRPAGPRGHRRRGRPQRAAARLGARKIASTTAPVIFENRLADLADRPADRGDLRRGGGAGRVVPEGQAGPAHVRARASPSPTIPLRVRGLGSAPFDDEGVATERRDLIADGVLTTWLLNTASARQLGLATTGHASRGRPGAPGVSVAQPHRPPGPRRPGALMARAGSGLQVTAMFGPSLNANTGDWSAGVLGLWWEGGDARLSGHRDHRRRQPDRHLRPPRPGERPGDPRRLQRALAVRRRPGDRGQVSERPRAPGRGGAGGRRADARDARGASRSRAKSDGSPVTDADLAVDALLKRRLLGARPDYGWLSEETADDPGAAGPAARVRGRSDRRHHRLHQGPPLVLHARWRWSRTARDPRRDPRAADARAVRRVARAAARRANGAPIHAAGTDAAGGGPRLRRRDASSAAPRLAAAGRREAQRHRLPHGPGRRGRGRRHRVADARSGSGTSRPAR